MSELQGSSTAELPHHLVVTVERDGYMRLAIGCPHTGADRPCAVWYEKVGACTCPCEACSEAVHEDCEQDYIEEVGRKYCQAEPADECWYAHAVKEVGAEVLDIAGELRMSVAVHLRGCSWNDPIEVTPA